MKLIKDEGTWSVRPSGDHKRHYLSSPDCPIEIVVDTDDYTDDTFPAIEKLLTLLATNWNP